MGRSYEAPRHSNGNNFVFADGHVKQFHIPDVRWADGGPWVVPDMSMYSGTDQWETKPVP